MKMISNDLFDTSELTLASPGQRNVNTSLSRCQWDMPAVWSGANSNSYSALIKVRFWVFGWCWPNG